MSGATAHRPAARGRRTPRAAGLSHARTEQIRVAAETMAVGVLVLLFSLPVVTAGAAWCAAAEITAGWHQGREPGLMRTFLRVVRRDFAPGLVLEGTVAVLLAATWFETHVVLHARMPGYPVEAAALAALGAAAVAFVLLTVACRAAAGEGWAAGVSAAAHQARTAPTTLALTVTACAFTGVLVALVPAFAGFMAGPLVFAVSAVVTRNLRRQEAGIAP